MRIRHRSYALFIAPTLAVATTRASRAQSTLPSLARPPQQSIFVPPNTIVTIKETSVFVKSATRSVMVIVASPTVATDSTRLLVEAKAVVAWATPLIDRQHATSVTV